MIKERRKSSRFVAEDRAFVSVGIKNPKVGKIGDISSRGLAFEYLVNYARNKKTKDSSDKNHLQAKIFLVGGGLCLSDVPCKVVYDIVRDVLTSSSIIKKRCGIQFGEMTDDQMRQLGDFLVDHTIGLVPE